jgi:hypothetical protein
MKSGGGRAWLLLAIWLAFLNYAGAAEQEFRFKNADAQSVVLMGEFNGWKGQPMTKGSDGVWTTKVSLGAGTYGYKFLVNGTDWILDPENSKKKTLEGVDNSAIEISEQGSAAAPTPRPALSPTATVTRLTTSSSLSSLPTPKTTLNVTPGEILILEVPLCDKRRAEAVKDGNPKLAHAKVGLAVPQAFDPQKSWPILVVCNTEAYSNIDSMRQFKEAALAEGWMTLAADAVEAEKDKEGGNRWPCAAAAFDYLTAAWPAIKDWPVASGGMSGGGKNGAFLAAELAREHHRLIGMLMMGCNQDMASVAYRKSSPPNFLNAAVFLSSGKADKIATPEDHESVKNSLKATGFSKVRLENFDGAHDIHQPHIGEALRWFIAQSGTSSASPTPRKSDLDNFFKKK